MWAVILSGEHTPIPALLIPICIVIVMWKKPNWRMPPYTALGTRILAGVVLFPIFLAGLAFTKEQFSKFPLFAEAPPQPVKPRTEEDFKNDLLAGKYNKAQRAYALRLKQIDRTLMDKNISNFVGKGENGTLLPEDIHEQIANLRAEADYMLGAGVPKAKLWKGTVTGLRRDGRFVVLSAFYMGQHYKLYLFDAAAKERVQLWKEDDEILFSGNLGSEQSVTRWGGLTSPSFEFFPTYITDGKLEIQQPADQVAKLEQLEEQERVDAALQPVITQHCKEHVLATLKYPASGSFSWFKADLRKVGDNQWIYTDVVKAVNDMGGKLPVRFVCAASLDGQRVSTEVRMLDGQ